MKKRPKRPDIETRVECFGSDLTPEQWKMFKREIIITVLVIVLVIVGSVVYNIWKMS